MNVHHSVAMPKPNMLSIHAPTPCTHAILPTPTLSNTQPPKRPIQLRALIRGRPPPIQLHALRGLRLRRRPLRGAGPQRHQQVLRLVDVEPAGGDAALFGEVAGADVAVPARQRGARVVLQRLQVRLQRPARRDDLVRVRRVPGLRHHVLRLWWWCGGRGAALRGLHCALRGRCVGGGGRECGWELLVRVWEWDGGWERQVR